MPLFKLQPLLILYQFKGSVYVDFKLCLMLHMRQAGENVTQTDFYCHIKYGGDVRDAELDQLRHRLRETELAMERIVEQMAKVPLKLQVRYGVRESLLIRTIGSLAYASPCSCMPPLPCYKVLIADKSGLEEDNYNTGVHIHTSI
ncbi:hypothetical protein NQ317_008752 [Molorchus minor]|uniref:Uncharacterized protein n=1 Tax=Molorchus minor TaxID=1323400 RepID=A0ABQ9J3E9_9CUCU|nr:hypothetical protein NQ317_008752 [Molorchus minor]